MRLPEEVRAIAGPLREWAAGSPHTQTGLAGQERLLAAADLLDRLAADLDRTTDALKMIVHFPFDVMSDAPADLRQVKEIAGAALPEEGDES